MRATDSTPAVAYRDKGRVSRVERVRKWATEMIQIKRVYEAVSDQDGLRILVERLWPRGVRKEDAGIDLWLKSLAPSTELRKWFAHDVEKWAGFQRRYAKEMESNKDLLALLTHCSTGGNVTLIYSASDERHNSAVALREMLR